MAENPFGNFYTDLLEDQPQMAYQAAISSRFPQYDALPRPQQRQRDYWSGQYSDIYNQYLGERGQNIQTLAQGGTPQNMRSFSDYLENIPFTQRYAGLTPQQRGRGIRSFAPSTRYIFY